MSKPLPITLSKRSNYWRDSPNCRTRPGKRRRCRSIQIILISCTTALAWIAFARERTRLWAHQARWLRSRSYAPGIAFSSVFNANIKECGGGFGGYAGEGGRDTELRRHAVVAEEFVHVVSTEWSSCGVGETPYRGEAHVGCRRACSTGGCRCDESCCWYRGRGEGSCGRGTVDGRRESF